MILSSCLGAMLKKMVKPICGSSISSRHRGATSSKKTALIQRCLPPLRLEHFLILILEAWCSALTAACREDTRRERHFDQAQGKSLKIKYRKTQGTHSGPHLASRSCGTAFSPKDQWRVATRLAHSRKSARKRAMPPRALCAASPRHARCTPCFTASLHLALRP